MSSFYHLPFVSIMHIVFDFRRVQLFGSLKVYSSYWWVLLGSWWVPDGVLVGSCFSIWVNQFHECNKFDMIVRKASSL